MKTTVDIPNEILEEAMRHSGASSKRDAVVAALEDFNRRHRLNEARKFLGTFKDFITPQEVRNARDYGLRVGGSDTYEIIIYWSQDDNAFIAEVPELPGCVAHGSTQEKALANIRKAVKLWIKSAREFGDAVPEPRMRRLMLA